MVFDIINFYPSITKQLLSEALDFAAYFTTITESERNIIFQAENSTLINDEETWCNCKKTESLFDVTMGSFDGAETCELVGLFLLHEIKLKITGN